MCEYLAARAHQENAITYVQQLYHYLEPNEKIALVIEYGDIAFDGMLVEERNEIDTEGECDVHCAQQIHDECEGDHSEVGTL